MGEGGGGGGEVGDDHFSYLNMIAKCDHHVSLAEGF